MDALEFNPKNIYLLFDLDGDEDSDVLEISQALDGRNNATTWLNTDGNFEKVAMTRRFGNFNSENNYVLLDANNDDLIDLVQVWQGQDGTANATTYLADEQGKFGRFGNFVDNWDFGDFDPERTYTGIDYNNDGFNDLIHRNDNPDSNSVWTVYLGDGSGSFAL